MLHELPAHIDTPEELDELLSRPSERLVDFMSALDGDIMVVGAGGKIGPTMARMAKRAVDAADVDKTVFAVDLQAMPELEAEGIETRTCDVLDLASVEKLPQVENIIYMIGRKFGSTGSEHLTWAINVIAPYHVARTFPESRIAAFSTGCVYPVMHLFSGGATEDTPPDPVGEYAMSCLGRERVFDFYAHTRKTRIAQIRLNYAVELRYGVLADIAEKVWRGDPVDITTGFANVLWQGDACNQVIQSLGEAAAPPAILNITGPETFSIRQVALQFGTLLDRDVKFSGEENGRAYLNNSARAHRKFGYPSVPLGRIVEWVAHWVKLGGDTLGKATHFETQDGKY